MQPLGERAIAIYEYIVEHIETKSYPPTQTEIAAYFDISKSTARNHLIRLRDRGYVTYPHNSSRAIELTGKTPAGWGFPNLK